jgi:UDP-N-acetylglucosamine 3-dehydrogenase
MKDYTFSVIGSGFMGSVLARVASQLPYAHCVAASDLDLARATRLVEAVGGQAFDDFDDMLARCPADAVIIATPEPDHLAPVLSACKAGSHILLEKPIATTLSDADRIIQASAEANIKLLVGQILRFEINYALIQSAIAEGSIGRFLSAYARRIAPINEAYRLGGRVSPVSYIGVHDIDQLLWYHPVPVRSVYAHALFGRVWEQLHTYDLAWMMIEFEDGALGVHEVGWCLPEEWAKWETPASWGGFGDVRMNVVGTHGNLNLDFTPMDLFGVNREGWKHPDTRHWPSMHGKLVGAAKQEVEHFFDCLRENKLPLVSGKDARNAMEVMLAAEMSIAEGRKVDLPLK